MDNNKSILIYAEAAFSSKSREKFPLRAKVADGVIRYSQNPIKGVVDSTGDDTTVKDVLGIREDIKMYKTIKSFLEDNKADVLLIGTAPNGGEIESGLLDEIMLSIENGMDIVNGMHYELRKNHDIMQAANKHNVNVWDVRVPPEHIPVASCKAYDVKKPIILTCAADAAIGKMTLGFSLEHEMLRRGIKGELLATGQTAIMIKGKGISIDRVIGDFMPGAVEKLVIESPEDNRFLVIEGQGGLSHPGYAPVTLALIHGGMPSHAILVVRPPRKHSIGSKLIKLPDPIETMRMYEAVSLPIRKLKFIGIAVHSQGMGEAEARDYIEKLSKETKLPVEDIIRFPSDVLADALENTIHEYENQ